MIQRTASELLVCEILYAFGGYQCERILTATIQDSFLLVWRIAQIREEIQRSPFRHAFL
jgi:hypothetical protein